MIWLCLLGWVTSALCIGHLSVRNSLAGEQRLAARIAYFLTAGSSIQIVALFLLWGFLPLGLSLKIVLVAGLLAGIVLAMSARDSERSAPTTWGMGAAETAICVALMGVSAVSTFIMFTSAASGWDAEALYLHTGSVAWLSTSPFPPTSPLEPDDPLRYRFGIHALAAAFSAASSEFPRQSLAATTGMLFAMSVVFFVGASLRANKSARPGLVAAFLSLFGGSAYPYYLAVRGYEPGQQAASNGKEWFSGILWHGNTLDMVQINVSMALGIVMFASALWLCAEALVSIRSRALSILAASAGLAALGPFNEVYFAALVAGLATVAAAVLVKTKFANGHANRQFLTRCAAIVSTGIIFVVMRGGVLGGISLSGGDSGSLRLALNVEHLGHVVTPPGEWGAQWVPLLSVGSMIDTDFVVVGVPILMVLAVRGSNLYATVGLVASAVLLALWLTVYPSHFPHDAYRFGHAAMVVYLCMAPFALASRLESRSALSTKLRRLTSGVAVAVAAFPHLALLWALAIAPPEPREGVIGSPDFAAAMHLRESTGTSRVFIPLKAQDDTWTSLYHSDAPATAMRVMLGLSGHAIPMGFVEYFNPQRYLPAYRRASLDFNLEDLSRLRVNWVYVIPSVLDPSQQRNLDQSILRGDLVPEVSFGNAGTETERRLLLVKARAPD